MIAFLVVFNSKRDIIFTIRMIDYTKDEIIDEAEVMIQELPDADNYLIRL